MGVMKVLKSSSLDFQRDWKRKKHPFNDKHKKALEKRNRSWKKVWKDIVKEIGINIKGNK